MRVSCESSGGSGGWGRRVVRRVSGPVNCRRGTGRRIHTAHAWSRGESASSATYPGSLRRRPPRGKGLRARNICFVHERMGFREPIVVVCRWGVAAEVSGALPGPPRLPPAKKRGSRHAATPAPRSAPPHRTRSKTPPVTPHQGSRNRTARIPGDAGGLFDVAPRQYLRHRCPRVQAGHRAGKAGCHARRRLGHHAGPQLRQCCLRDLLDRRPQRSERCRHIDQHSVVHHAVRRQQQLLSHWHQRPALIRPQREPIQQPQRPAVAAHDKREHRRCGRATGLGETPRRRPKNATSKGKPGVPRTTSWARKTAPSAHEVAGTMTGGEESKGADTFDFKLAGPPLSRSPFIGRRTDDPTSPPLPVKRCRRPTTPRRRR